MQGQLQFEGSLWCLSVKTRCQPPDWWPEIPFRSAQARGLREGKAKRPAGARRDLEEWLTQTPSSPCAEVAKATQNSFANRWRGWLGEGVRGVSVKDRQMPGPSRRKGEKTIIWVTHFLASEVSASSSPLPWEPLPPPPPPRKSSWRGYGLVTSVTHRPF